MNHTSTAQIGDNMPPNDADPLRDRLNEDYATLATRRDELLDALDRVPENVNDDETAGKVADFINQLKSAAKHADKCRTDEKETYLEGGRTVDGFFKSISDPLLKAKKQVEQVLTIYQRAKADEERRRREAEERAAQEAAEKARQEAEEKAQIMADQAGLDDAVEADETAAQAAADAAKAAHDASAKAAELSRTRSEHGSVSSLRTYWDFTDMNRDAVNLEALRHHIPEDALEKAVRSFIKAGGRELTGVKIFENSKTVVR